MMIPDMPAGYHYEIPRLQRMEDAIVIPWGYKQEENFYIVDVSFQSQEKNIYSEKIRLTFNVYDGSVADLSIYRYGFRPFNQSKAMELDFNEVIWHLMCLNYYRDIYPYYQKIKEEMDVHP